MKAVTSEMIFNILKAHLKHEPDWKIIELAAKMQNPADLAGR
jgi:hypothetical protein